MSERTNEHTNDRTNGRWKTNVNIEALLVQTEVQLVKFAHSFGRLLHIYFTTAIRYQQWSIYDFLNERKYKTHAIFSF